MHEAAWGGHLAVVEFLVDRGTPMDTADEVSCVAMTVLVRKHRSAVALCRNPLSVFKNIIFVIAQCQQRGWQGWLSLCRGYSYSWPCSPAIVFLEMGSWGCETEGYLLQL